MYSSILTLFFLLKIAKRSQTFAPKFNLFMISSVYLLKNFKFKVYDSCFSTINMVYCNIILPLTFQFFFRFKHTRCSWIGKCVITMHVVNMLHLTNKLHEACAIFSITGQTHLIEFNHGPETKVVARKSDWGGPSFLDILKFKRKTLTNSTKM